MLQTVRVLYGSDSGGGLNDGAFFACQLGLVGCLWAGVYEIGRQDVGVALRSREEDDARDKVWEEFQVSEWMRRMTNELERWLRICSCRARKC